MPSAVDPAYRHIEKTAQFLYTLQFGEGRLKIYDIATDAQDPDEDVAAAVNDWAANHLSKVCDPGDLGFLIYHRCGPDFRFLLPAIWRGNNELWEAVWYRDGDARPFAPFPSGYPDLAGVPRPTFCVWELGVVAHEAASWTRFLQSNKDEASRREWEADTWSGIVR